MAMSLTRTSLGSRCRLSTASPADSTACTVAPACSRTAATDSRASGSSSTTSTRTPRRVDAAGARSPLKAGDAVESLEREPSDVLVSDIAMPGVDGYTLLGRARARLRGREIPAAALTVYAGSEDRGRALAAGFQAHLAKPVDPAE